MTVCQKLGDHDVTPAPRGCDEFGKTGGPTDPGGLTGGLLTHHPSPFGQVFAES